MSKKIVTKKSKSSTKSKQVVQEKPQVVETKSPVVVSPPVKTEAEKIWDEIKNLSISMFGLPNQFVFQHCTPVTVEPNNLYVTIRSTATLPSLETAISPAFSVELADKFIIVKRVPLQAVTHKR